MSLPPTQRTVLARLSDEEWRLGYDLTGAGAVLSALERRGFIRDDMSDGTFLDRNWTITPDGLEELEMTA